MKYLNKSDINLVKPRFRKTVQAAFDKGEKVPYGVIYLSDAPITQKEIDWAHKVIKKNNIKD